MNNVSPLNFNGTQIRTDEHERINMTDLWKASGKDKTYKPYEWSRKICGLNKGSPKIGYPMS